jgi:hypothetical protein
MDRVTFSVRHYPKLPPDFPYPTANRGAIPAPDHTRTGQVEPGEDGS